MKKTLLLTPLLALALSGCVDTSITDGKFKFTTKRFLWQGNIESASFTAGSNGLANAQIQGYKSEPAELVKAAAEGVAKGLAGAIKP